MNFTKSQMKLMLQHILREGSNLKQAETYFLKI